MWRHGSVNFEFQNSKSTKAIISENIKYQRWFYRVYRDPSFFLRRFIHITDTDSRISLNPVCRWKIWIQCLEIKSRDWKAFIHLRWDWKVNMMLFVFSFSELIGFGNILHWRWSVLWHLPEVLWTSRQRWPLFSYCHIPRFGTLCSLDLFTHLLLSS